MSLSLRSTFGALGGDSSTCGKCQSWDDTYGINGSMSLGNYDLRFFVFDSHLFLITMNR